MGKAVLILLFFGAANPITKSTSLLPQYFASSSPTASVGLLLPHFAQAGEAMGHVGSGCADAYEIEFSTCPTEQLSGNIEENWFLQDRCDESIYRYKFPLHWACLVP
jgi:hypothetical protein